MWNYYKSVAWKAMKGILTKGTIIILLFKAFIILCLSTLIGRIAVDNLWTKEGFISNWYWVVGPFLGLVFLFWLWELLCINHKNVEIIKPELIVDYKEGEQSYQQWDPSNDDPRYLLHRIRIFNKGQKPSHKITAQIKTIKPPSTDGIRGLPIKLHVMGRDTPPLCNDPIFDLNGESEEFVDVISLGKRQYNPHNLLFPVGSYSNPQSIWLADNQDYELHITIFADGTKYCDKVFHLKEIEDQNNLVRHRFSEE